MHHGRTTKTQHIAAWASLLKATPTKQASYAITKGDWVITQQLLRYDARKRDNDDDAIDACSYGPQITLMYMGRIIDGITKEGRFDVARPQATYQVSAV